MSHLPTAALSNHHVVVFGASAGIGLATAAAAKAHGARVTLVGRSLARLEAAAAQIGGATTAVADIAKRTEVEAVFSRLERVDHLVVTAGGLQVGRLGESDPDYLLEALNERIAGAVYAIKAALPLMPPTASIVLMGGQYSDRPAAEGAALISASVRGIEALARSLMLELKPIRVNVVSPGLIDTGLFDVFGPEARASIFERAAASLPVGRVGTAEEVAEAILFLLGNRYMNGEVLHIDGGGRFV